MNTTLAPRKLPRQSRSQATVGAILDATARVLIERGYAATTTNAVAELAAIACRAPVISQNSFSSVAVCDPVVIHPERRTAATASMSSSLI